VSRASGRRNLTATLTGIGDEHSFDVRVLGTLEVVRDGRPIALAGPKQRSVLAMLALDANHVMSTDMLIEQIWGDENPQGARRSLQVYVANLRKLLGDGARIESRGGGYVLEVTPDDLDLHRFSRLAAQAREARDKGTIESAARLLREALDLWRGPPLADFTYERFAGERIRRLEKERLEVLELRIELDLALGRHSEVVRELSDLVVDYPLHEHVRALLMTALYRCGRQGEALQVFTAGRELLLDELGVDPSRELQELERAILDQDPILEAPRPSPTTVAPDEGGSSVNLLEFASASPGNLPTRLTSFIGRERELSEVRSLMAGSRLVTLCGPGGSGKSRLAHQVAAELAVDYGDGAWLVELAPIADEQLVAAKVGSALRVSEVASRPEIETIIDAIRDRHALLILDGCEHVLDATAKLVDAVMLSCPAMQILATSREPLRLAAEHSYRVPSLSLPPATEHDASQLAAFEAVRLFAERASQHRADFKIDAGNAEVVARLCRHLDGIPLAIELTAARIRSMSLTVMEAHLGERFQLAAKGPRTALPHHQTLKASIDWSWDLLTQAEKAALVRLGVFAGGWDLDAAETVVATGATAPWEVLEHLDALVDKSLVQVDDTEGTIRYRLLETVRDYANAKLAEQPEDAAAARAAHRDYYLALAESAAPYLRARGQAEWLERLEHDHDNLRAALAFSRADPDPEPGLRLAVALCWFWLFRGHAAEGVDALNALLDCTETQPPPNLRGRALVTLAALLGDSDNHTAGARAEEALAIGYASHDDPLIVNAFSMLSWVRYRRGDSTGALGFAEAGLAIARTLGDPQLTAWLLNSRGGALNELGDTAAANECFERARDLHRQTGNRVQAGWVLSNLGYTKLTARDLVSARAILREALASPVTGEDRAHIFAAFNLGLVEYLDHELAISHDLFAGTLTAARSVGDVASVADALLGLALTSSHDPRRAAELHGAADAARERLGVVLEHFEAQLRDRDQATLREALGADAFETHFHIGRNLPREEAVAYALAEPESG
jgi:predicted ATPase/DNA-binding SARP family transcriptional activator